MLYSDTYRTIVRDFEEDQGFHPFQGSALFGHYFRNSEQGRLDNVVSIPFREVLYSDRNPKSRSKNRARDCFHPFQGSALFGRYGLYGVAYKVRYVVSIPFREVLYSDLDEFVKILEATKNSFHPFQGSALFGPIKLVPSDSHTTYGFHPFQGSALFGRKQHFRPHKIVWLGFHPFQGSALFGLHRRPGWTGLPIHPFPSLSGKTSIRTLAVVGSLIARGWMFPSLSGKTSIRTEIERQTKTLRIHPVSIPFREDLYSDVEFIIDPHGKTYTVFPSLSGKTSIRTIIDPHGKTYTVVGGFHPFQGRPLFGQIKELLIIGGGNY